MATGRRSGRGWLALALAWLVTVVPAASAQTDPFRAEEGDWSGFVAFTGGGMPFRGSFAFNSAGGEVDGTFQWAGPSVQIGGVVSGPDTMPRFDLTSVVSGGIDVPDVSGGGEIMFTAATCERLEGTGVNIDVAQMVEIGSIVWWAVRSQSTADVEPFFEALQALREEVGEVLGNLEAGIVTVGGIFDRVVPSLAEAERLASQLARSEGCGGEFYRSLLASEVEQLLLYVLANPDLNAFLLGQVLVTALRAGVIGSGSATSDGVLETATRDLIEVRVFTAIEEANATELLLLGAMAEDLGWDDLAADIQFALEAMSE